MANAKKSTKAAKSVKANNQAKNAVNKPVQPISPIEQALRPETLEEGQDRREAAFAKCQWITMNGEQYWGVVEISAGIIKFVNCLKIDKGDTIKVSTAKWFEGNVMATLKQFTIVGANCTATMSDFTILEKKDIKIALIYIRANVAKLGSSILSKAIKA